MTATKLVAVDVGGTFTDVVAIDGGKVSVSKVPTDVVANEVSVLRGAAEVGVGNARVFNVASTAGLNAIITRRLPKVAFLTTMGHRDMLDGGRIWRPYEHLTDPTWRRAFGDAARPLVPRYLRRGILERMAADGSILIPLDEAQARQELEVVARCHPEGVAICLLHAYRNPTHEVALRELVREVVGDVPCSISSEVSQLAKEYQRASTTTIDLLMRLIFQQHVENVRTGLDDLGFEGELNFADCSAMLMPADYAMTRAHRLIVGGPAAGTVAGAHFGDAIGEDALLCADVGGTSCDISVVLDGRPWVNNTFEPEWDMVVNAVSTEIVTLGAGGGSIMSIGRSGDVRVGPESAGAVPGPACYGLGGEQPTITDAALLAGVLAVDRFAGGRMSLDAGLAHDAFARLDTRLTLSERVRYTWMIGLDNIAEGVVDVTIRHGLDARDLTLLAFGAAGPMLLPAILDLLPLRRVVVPPHPGTFSALGLLSTDQVFSDSRTAQGVLDHASAPQLARLYADLEEEILAAAGVHRDEVTVVRSFDARLLGQSWETPFVSAPAGPITAETIDEMVAGFHAEYERRNGHRLEQFPVEALTFRVDVVAAAEKIAYPAMPQRAAGSVPTAGGIARIRHLYDDGDGVEAATYERSALAPGDRISGPAIVREPTSTTFVPLARTLEVGDRGELVIGGGT